MSYAGRVRRTHRMTHLLARVSSRQGLVALALVALVLVTGCGKSRSFADEPAPPTAAASPAAPPPAAGDTAPTAPRARAVSVDTTLHVRDVEASARAVREGVARSGGYVADASTSGGGEERTARFDVRVPEHALAGFLAALSGAGETASYSERTEDVTFELADTKARLASARAEEKRLLELMATRTASLADVLAAEKELARVRETIERYDAQERTIEHRVAFATVRVTLAPHAVATYETPGKSIARAAAAGVRGAASFFLFAAMAIVAVLPTLLPLALVTALVVLVVRRMRARRPVAAAEN